MRPQPPLCCRRRAPRLTGRLSERLLGGPGARAVGGFDSEEQAALAYDIAAVKCRGNDAVTNYPIANYAQELANLEQVTKDELVLSLRRQSKGFVKGTSKYRGVTRHQKGKWEARIGQLVGKKYRYLGLFDSEEDAAAAYDREAVRQKGLDAITNFASAFPSRQQLVRWLAAPKRAPVPARRSHGVRGRPGAALHRER